MSCAKNWYDQSEDAKPEVASDILKVRQAKANSIRSAARQRAAERKKKFAVNKGKTVSQFSENHGKWQESFRRHRSQQRHFSQWASKNRLPVKIFGGRRNIHATSVADLGNFQPLDVDTESESYKIFDRCWNEYDDEGFGHLSYRSFETMLRDIGYQFARPSWKQVDPMRTQKVTFQAALEWWGRSMDKADRSDSQRVSPKKRKLASTVKEGKFVVDTKNEIDYLTAPQVKRARLNARKKLAAKSNAFRKFRQSKKGTRNERTIASVTFKGQTTEFDITDYEPVEIKISEQQKGTVDLIWSSHDKAGVGSLSYEEFQKMMQNPQMFQKADCAFAKEGSEVKYEDFVQWWFSEDKAGKVEEEKDQEPPKREVARVNKMLESRGKAAALRKQLRGKHSTESAKFRKFRKSPRKKQAPWKVEISATKNGETKKFEYDVSNYQPAFIPRGKEEELRHLDLIWKHFDKDGCGHLDATQFQKVLGKLGLELTDDRVCKQLQDGEGNIWFEKFSTWWFSTASNDTAPKAPPAPEEKRQKVSAIRASDKNTAKKNMSKYKLSEDNEWAQMRHSAQIEARKRSAAFKKFRVENSPSPRKVRPGAKHDRIPITWWAVGTPASSPPPAQGPTDI